MTTRQLTFSLTVFLALTACNSGQKQTENDKDGIVKVDSSTTGDSNIKSIESSERTDSVAIIDSISVYKKYSTKTISTYLNGDNLLDTIVLSSTLKDNSSFNKISISLTSFGRQTFTAKESWSTVDSSFLATNMNDITSTDIFVKKNNNQTVILLFGLLDGAGYREEFSIISIANNAVKMVFDHLQNEIDVEIPTTLTDLDKDGKLDFVYTGYREVIGNPPDGLQGVIEVYCPFWVYSVDSNCILNEPLTKKYNEDNYAFAGFKYSEKIGVYKPANGGHKRACKWDKNRKVIWLTK